MSDRFPATLVFHGQPQGAHGVVARVEFGGRLCKRNVGPPDPDMALGETHQVHMGVLRVTFRPSGKNRFNEFHAKQNYFFGAKKIFFKLFFFLWKSPWISMQRFFPLTLKATCSTPMCT